MSIEVLCPGGYTNVILYPASNVMKPDLRGRVNVGRASDAYPIDD